MGQFSIWVQVENEQLLNYGFFRMVSEVNGEGEFFKRVEFQVFYLGIYIVQKEKWVWLEFRGIYWQWKVVWILDQGFRRKRLENCVYRYLGKMLEDVFKRMVVK